MINANIFYWNKNLKLSGDTNREEKGDITLPWQQDGRKKRTAKFLCVTNVTGLSIVCFVMVVTQL